MSLTDMIIRSTKPMNKTLRLSDGEGLVLLIESNGARGWRFRYRFNGKYKMISLGTYPFVSLKEARLEKAQARELLSQGIDPSQVRKAEKLSKATLNEYSFEAVARQWWINWSSARVKRYADSVLRRLEGDLFPELGTLPIAEIEAPSLIKAIKKIEARGALDVAYKAFEKCAQIMRYAIAHGLAKRNPTADINPSDILPPLQSKNLARLKTHELPELLGKIETYNLPPCNGQPLTRLALQLMALTFVRTSDLIEAVYNEFNLEKAQWHIPAERMKMPTPHIVPLSKQAIEVIQHIRQLTGPNMFLLPNVNRGHKKTMSNNTMLYALYRMGYHSRMTGHGFRGMASTILHEEGFAHEHIELQLAHQERDKVSAAYNYALYLKPRTEMMQWWADYLDSLKNHSDYLSVIKESIKLTQLPNDFEE